MTFTAEKTRFLEIRSTARQTLDRVRQELMSERVSEGHWTGFLSPSALSTATAVSAMAAVLRHASGRDDEVDLRQFIGRGISYLQDQQNSDGGFGDTDLSHSNIATSYLVLSASTLAAQVGEESLNEDAIERLNRYLDQSGRLDGLKKRYGKDKTFVVPIMNNMAIAGLISWDDVARLPFEAAVFPQSMYRFLQMPVVSYAIPALVAIGQARHFLGRKAILPVRMVRSLAINRTLQVLEKMQPESGGYLEATPLTAFVVMSLAATRRCDLKVVQNGLRFLKASMLDDGSWPIDTNLATWVTSLSIQALASDPDDQGQWYSDALASWHLGCQHKDRHPFTGAEPGGWGWTDLSGAVPDSDDTPAAILATQLMGRYASDAMKSRISEAQNHAADWLVRLQNRNGGWPTFCRGWGKLPFDRSSTDLTAHALRALSAMEHTRVFDSRVKASSRNGLKFLVKNQGSDGSWEPLWFGNQDREDESNPVYGTAKVLMANDLGEPSRQRGVRFLLDSQNPDGGWGGGASVQDKLGRFVQDKSESDVVVPVNLVSSVEETALAVDALSTCLLRERAVDRSDNPDFRKLLEQLYDSGNPLVSIKEGEKLNPTVAGNERVLAAILGGVEFLSQSVKDRRHEVAWPIGFYFAKLWYHERLYPLIFTVAALGKFLRATNAVYDDDWPR